MPKRVERQRKLSSRVEIAADCVMLGLEAISIVFLDRIITLSSGITPKL